MPRPKKSEQEDVRALILEKAKKLFLEIGYANLTIRRIAQEIGYTPGTIYLYFKNKDEILYELHNEGFRLLLQYKKRILEGGATDPVERLRRGGHIYIDFALENPEYYELMFNMPEPRDFMDQQARSGGEREDYALRSYGFLKESVRQFMAEGYLPGTDVDTAAFFFWSLAHGVVSLIIRKRFPYPQKPSKELAGAVIDEFMRWVEPSRYMGPEK
ncbi:MAG: TetR/AcrR family transcriptional regulator [Desulfarculaceae bacterium]|jgi:AcrR family transcriptional regulator